MPEPRGGPPGDGAIGRCAHCALPVRGRGGPPAPYCCLGCRLAATVAGGGDGQRQFLEARLLLASFLAMGVMTFSLVSYGEALSATGDEPGLAAVRNLLRGALALFGLPVLALLGVPLLAGAWDDLRRGVVRMDGLIVLATFAAAGLSLAATFTGTGEVYWETATMVLLLVTFGRRLEAHARARGRDAQAALAECLPRTAHRLPPAAAGEPAVEDVDPALLVSGDRCEIRPGEAAPADARVLAGRSPVRCAHLTGEQDARAAGPGDELPAGAIVEEETLLVIVLRPVAESRLAAIAALLDEPLGDTRRLRTVDRWASVLVAVAIALAVAGGLRSLALHGAGAGVSTALSVLLVGCPCAFGLATPLAYRALRAALCRHGLLVHGAQALERAAAVDHVVLDKTGTLTRPAGRLALAWAADAAAARLLPRLLRHSGHPLAAAVEGESGPPPAGLRLLPGCGVVAEVDGVPYRLGRPEWLGDGDWPDALPRPGAGDGASLLALQREGTPVALAAVEQELRPGVEEALARLAERVPACEILSGDRHGPTEAVAARLALPFRAALLPEDKRAHVLALQRQGRTVLAVGDGVNDAPLLLAADVGVALGSGTAAARAGADVHVVHDDLSALAVLLDGARDLRRVVRGNLAWATAYNGVALLAAASGHLHPLLAVGAMIGSSLAVVARSHRLLEWTPPGPRRRAVAPAAEPSFPAPGRPPAPRVVPAAAQPRVAGGAP